MKFANNIVFILVIVSTWTACDYFENEEDRPIAAKVYDKVLYVDQLSEVLESGLSEQDSLLHMRNFVDSWVKEQLLLKRAELNLTEEQKNVQQQLDKYRSSLLIYKYQSEFVKQKLDTLISDEQIAEYYKNNQENFKLGQIVIKGLYIKVPADAPDVTQVRRWYRSGREADSLALSDYCYQYATKYDFFDGKYTPFNTVMEQIPAEIGSPEIYLRFNKSIEASDSLYKYYLRIDEYLLRTDISPVEFVKEKIQNIILKKRELELISAMENKLYEEAIKNNSVEIIR